MCSLLLYYAAPRFDPSWRPWVREDTESKGASRSTCRTEFDSSSGGADKYHRERGLGPFLGRKALGYPTAVGASCTRGAYPPASFCSTSFATRRAPVMACVVLETGPSASVFAKKTRSNGVRRSGCTLV
jgi:hypothetical protein